MKIKREIIALLVPLLFLALHAVLQLNFNSVKAAPQVPQAPTVLLNEDFETSLSDGQIALVAQTLAAPPTPRYVSASGGFYQAEGQWTSADDCNGFVLDGNTADAAILASGCDQATALKLMANGLGTFNGSPNSLSNHVVGAITWPNRPGPAGLVELRTETPLNVGSRFVAFSVNAAATFCHLDPQPALHFFIDDGASQIPLTPTAINPCTAATVIAGDPSSRVDNYTSSGPVLYQGASLSLVLRNETPDGDPNGDNHALDDISLLDVSPSLDKVFGTGSFAVGQPIPLTFTITNTTDLAAKSGWSFTDNLASQLTVADTPNLQNSCANSTVTAVPGSSTISVTGDLTAGQAFCEIALNVAASAGGTFMNGPGNLSLTGLKPPTEASVTVEGPTPAPLADTGQYPWAYLLTAATIILTSLAIVVWHKRPVSAGQK